MDTTICGQCYELIYLAIVTLKHVLRFQPAASRKNTKVFVTVVQTVSTVVTHKGIGHVLRVVGAFKEVRK